MTTIDPHRQTSSGAGALNAGLWAAQVLVAVTFVGGGLWKLVTPISQVAETFPWAGEVSSGVLYVSAVFDILGGLGVLLPSVTRIKPRLTVLAALGCVALQGSAIVFHVARGEGADTGVNVAFLALAAFIAWGRWSMRPIGARD